MFDGQEMVKEIFNLNKNHWLNTMEMMSAFQNQTEKMWNTMQEQGFVVQHEGRKMFQDWLNRTKQAQDQFSETMKDSWKKAETVFGVTPKTGK